MYGFAVLDPANLVIKPHDSWADFDNSTSNIYIKKIKNKDHVDPPPLEMENSQNEQMHCTFFPLDMICNVIYERFEKCIAILEFEMSNKLLGASTTKYFFNLK